MSPAAKKIRIGMYNVGFGDAFLVRIPGKKGDRKILFDCGSIKQGDGGPIDSVVDAIIEDVKDADGKPRIDVVVATHRHRDHVSGFANEGWSEVEVREVWMPWTEDPADPEARRIREAQSRLALALHEELTRIGAAADVIDLAANALSNEAAMQTLHAGFGGEAVRRYLPPRDRRKRTFTADCLPGVTIHAMGPSFDESVITNMDPPEGKSYLQLVAAGAADRKDPRPPFPGDWTYEGLPAGSLSAEERAIVDGVGEGDESVVAAALDGAVNGTSLVLMLQTGRNYLLFPGDAQWGTWNMILGDAEWTALLKKTTFLKVGHHGSHNATPRPFVDDLLPKSPKELWAMVSTIQRGSWPIPKKELMTALAKHTKRIVRSDEIPGALQGVFKPRASLYVETEIPV